MQEIKQVGFESSQPGACTGQTGFCLEGRFLQHQQCRESGKSSLREISSPFPFPLAQAARRICSVSVLGGMQTQLDTARLSRRVLSSLLQLTLLRAGGWSGRSPRVPTSLGHPVNPHTSSEVTGPVLAPGLGLAQPTMVGAGPAPGRAKAELKLRDRIFPVLTVAGDSWAPFEELRSVSLSPCFSSCVLAADCVTSFGVSPAHSFSPSASGLLQNSRERKTLHKSAGPVPGAAVTGTEGPRGCSRIL